MKENVNLIKEINDLQREKKLLKDDVSKKQSMIAATLLKKKNISINQVEDLQLTLYAQKDEIKYLQEKIKEISLKNQTLKEKRPPSSGSKFFLYILFY